MEEDKRSNPFTLAKGSLLKNRYQVTEVLGIGGFGITYKVIDTYTQKIFAMKEYAPAQFCNRSLDGCRLQPLGDNKVEALEHGRTRFLDEANILRKIDSIAGVVSIMDCFNENETSYFVMEYLEGMTLKEYLKQHDGRLGVGETLYIMGAVAYALDRVHAKASVFHRDISPDNIFITNNKEVRVIDFGNARNIVSSESQTYSVILKPGFAPMEQYSHKGKQGSYTDVYSLAGTMYYCLTGMMIPSAPERMSGNDYIHIRDIFPELTQSFSDALDHALALDYHKRTNSMLDLMIEFGLDSTLYEDKIKIKPYLELINGNNVGRRFNLQKDTCITIGRSKKSDIVFEDNLYISKKHCEVYFDSSSRLLFIEDYSTNGTFVDSKKLKHGELTKLEPGQQFAIGDKNTVLKVGVINV